ncbi:hypothetical protein HZB88_03010 [archaeon]|nr:hypothetical protein [archaeon]
MKAILIDAYRNNDDVIVWLKTPEENIRLVTSFKSSIYLECCDLAESLLKKYNLKYNITTKTTYLNERKKVFEITINRLSRYERIVKRIEYETKHRIKLYNADIPPEQMFLYKNNLKPFSYVELQDNHIYPLKEEPAVELDKMTLEIIPYEDIRINEDTEVKKIIIDNKTITGNEIDILKQFKKIFESRDPDVLSIESAFSKLPYLVKRFQFHNLSCNFNRWDDKPIKKKGGKTFFSYGKVMYREYAVRLNGRFLIDSNTTVGEECNIDGIIELSNLSGTRFQQIASRSFGAVFQSALVAEMIRRDCLVPFKEKPVDRPISLFHQLKFDRVGHTFDPIVGLHKDVAEIDFSSLFPWIIYNYNVSTETLLNGDPPYQDVPGIPLKISLKNKGIVPIAIKPMIDRRMHYKKHPTSINKNRIQGLKWVLVTSYGYLRFREFKLGIASSHMAIGAFARNILLRAKEICEEHGCTIVHGIVDSLYIQKKGIDEILVKKICKDIEYELGIPISFEGIFKWIVFLPSVNNINRPVPTRYYGTFMNGEVKARGMEVRQSGSPKIVRQYQREILNIMSGCETKDEMLEHFNFFCQLLRKYLFLLPTFNGNLLSCFIRVSKTDYKNNIPQKAAIELMKRSGISVVAGQKVYFVYGKKGIELPDNYKGKPDTEIYKRLFVRSLFVLLQPFGFTKAEINELTKNTRQSKLAEFDRISVSVILSNLHEDLTAQST